MSITHGLDRLLVKKDTQNMLKFSQHFVPSGITNPLKLNP